MEDYNGYLKNKIKINFFSWCQNTLSATGRTYVLSQNHILKINKTLSNKVPEKKKRHALICTTYYLEEFYFISYLWTVHIIYRISEILKFL